MTPLLLTAVSDNFGQTILVDVDCECTELGRHERCMERKWSVKYV